MRIVFIVVGACGSVSNGPNGRPLDAGGVGGDASTGQPLDAGGDTSTARCSPTAAFDAPMLVPGLNLNTTAFEYNAQLTPDELGMYFIRDPGMVGSGDIYVTSRTSIDSDFGNPSLVANVNGATSHEFSPTVTADGLTMYLSSNRVDPMNDDVFVATRASPSVDFSIPVPVAAVNSATTEVGTYVIPDGHALYFSRDSPQSVKEIYRAELGATGFGPPVPVQGLGAVGDAGNPVVSTDERAIFFRSANGGSDVDIWTALRASPRDTFGPPTRIDELSTSGYTDEPSWISADGCVLYFASDRAGGTAFDLYVAHRGH